MAVTTKLQTMTPYCSQMTSALCDTPNLVSVVATLAYQFLATPTQA